MKTLVFKSSFQETSLIDECSEKAHLNIGFFCRRDWGSRCFILPVSSTQNLQAAFTPGFLK